MTASIFIRKFQTQKQASEINGFITNSQSYMAAFALIIDLYSEVLEERRGASSSQLTSKCRI